MAATVETQMGGAVQTVDELPDIAAEQAAIANREAAATKQIEAVAATQKPETVVNIKLEAEELTPAAKQAAQAGDEGEIDFNDFLAQKHKTEAELAAKVETLAETPATKVAAAPVLPAARDYADLPAEYHEVAKKMSNEAYSEFKKAITERQTLTSQLAEAKKGALPDNYYEHDNAYVLTPEFEQQSVAVSRAEQVLNHWRGQLNAVREGAETYTVLQQDAQGNFVTSAPLKVDRTTDVQLAEIHNWAQNQYMQAQGNLNAISQTHKQRVADSRAALTNFERTAFPVFENPQHKPVVDDTVRKMLPKAYHSNPLAPILAKAVLIMQHQAGLLSKQPAATNGATPAAAKPVAKAAPSVAPSVAPSAAEIAGGGSAAKSNKDEDVTIDMFQRAKKGLPL